MAEIRIAIIGFGKIAQDQHLPAIAANGCFRLVAAVAPVGAAHARVPVYDNHRQMLAQIQPDAVAICTPPGPRHAIARDCLEAGVHVLLEKPPAATLGEVNDLATLSTQRQLSLFTAWHAQFNEGVAVAARLIADEGLSSLHIEWLEDVEKWHPGQTWRWAAGGFGVFDSGINALSIATTLSPAVLLLRRAKMTMHPSGQQPVAATMEMTGPGVDGPIHARLDWRHKGADSWTIKALTKAGTQICLSDGGAVLQIGTAPHVRGRGGEYPELYKLFERLVRTGGRHVDAEPLRLTADVFMAAERAEAGKA